MAIWASEVVWGLDPIATLYGRTADEAYDAGVRWVLANVDAQDERDEGVSAFVHGAVPVVVAACEDCGHKLLAASLTIAAEGGHGQGVDGEPTMLMCALCHEENHQDAHGRSKARLVEDVCSVCFPERVAEIRATRRRVQAALARAELDNDGLERLHRDIFEEVS